MNIHSAAPTDPDSFLRWNEGREGKRELVNGKIIEMMTGATLGHARVVKRLSRILEQFLDEERFEVVTVDLGVKTPAGVRYPDIVVDLSGADAVNLSATAPVLIAEVLSPSSIAIGMVEKAAEYIGIPSVLAYLVLSQDQPRAWLWLRAAHAWTGPTMIEGDASIEVSALSLSVPPRLLY